MRREVCGGCNSTNLVEWLDLGYSPLANDYPAQPTSDLTMYPLGLVRCHRCTLLQSSAVVPDDELWNREYAFYTSGSWQVVQQQRDYALQVMERHQKLANGLVVEIGCNDGTMLKNFQEAGWRTLGVDPARGPAAKAQANGLDLVVEQFSFDVADRIVSEYGLASMIIANNVIAHVADLNDFIRGMALLLQPDGVAVVEFQYVVDLITGNQFDHVYHEHRSFFSLFALQQILFGHGLEPVHVQETSPQGGSLRVWIMNRGCSPVGSSVRWLVAREKWLNEPTCLGGLQGRADRIRHRLVRMLASLKSDGKVIAGYGAPAKSATLLNFCEIGPETVQYIVDTTLAKQGRYTPGTNIPIISPQADSRAPDVYLLLNWNYFQSIRHKESAFTGNWLVPIPLPELV